MPRCLIVVQPHEHELYKLLRGSFREDAPVAVIYERRIRERRRGSNTPRADRRRADRRQRRPSALLYQIRILRIDEPRASGTRASGRPLLAQRSPVGPRGAGR